MQPVPHADILTLVYPISSDGQRVLMQYHEHAESHSYQRFNGLESRPRPNETLIDACLRMLRYNHIGHENLTFKGTVHWSKFHVERPSLYGHLFLAHVPQDQEDTFHAHNHLGPLKWISIQELLRGEWPCWPGDAHIFPLLFDHHHEPFFGLMGYENGVPHKWSYQRGQLTSSF